MENNQEVDQTQYIDNAIRAVREKKPLPEIDFTLHTMEDGSQVSTQERVCKGALDPRAQSREPAGKNNICDFARAYSANRAVCPRCASTRLPPAQRRAILLTARPHQAQHPISEAALLPRRPPNRAASAMDHKEGNRDPKVGAQHAGNGRTHYCVWRRTRAVLRPHEAV